jgi:putative chitinase
MNFKNLQRKLGVTDDGVIGRGTLTALFKKLGQIKVVQKSWH